jgi:hypothetical protein
MTFSSDQRAVLKRAANLPRNIETLMDNFGTRMTTEEKLDPDFAFRVNFTPVLANRPAGADQVIEFSKATPQEAGAIAFIKGSRSEEIPARSNRGDDEERRLPAFHDAEPYRPVAVREGKRPEAGIRVSVVRK